MNKTPCLEERMEEKRVKRLAAMPETWRGPTGDAYRGEAPPRRAIKAFCGECQGYDRKGIAECTAYACPLWNYRPFRDKLDGPDFDVEQTLGRSDGAVQDRFVGGGEGQEGGKDVNGVDV